VTFKQAKLVEQLPATASKAARGCGMTAPNAHTVLTRLERAGIVRSYYLKATRVFVKAEKRFKRGGGDAA